jgi:hypothetical protein
MDAQSALQIGCLDGLRDFWGGDGWNWQLQRSTPGLVEVSKQILFDLQRDFDV